MITEREFMDDVSFVDPRMRTCLHYTSGVAQMPGERLMPVMCPPEMPNAADACEEFGLIEYVNALVNVQFAPMLMALACDAPLPLAKQAKMTDVTSLYIGGNSTFRGFASAVMSWCKKPSYANDECVAWLQSSGAFDVARTISSWEAKGYMVDMDTESLNFGSSHPARLVADHAMPRAAQMVRHMWNSMPEDESEPDPNVYAGLALPPRAKMVASGHVAQFAGSFNRFRFSAMDIVRFLLSVYAKVYTPKTEYMKRIKSSVNGAVAPIAVLHKAGKGDFSSETWCGWIGRWSTELFGFGVMHPYRSMTCAMIAAANEDPHAFADLCETTWESTQGLGCRHGRHAIRHRVLETRIRLRASRSRVGRVPVLRHLVREAKHGGARGVRQAT